MLIKLFKLLLQTLAVDFPVEVFMKNVRKSSSGPSPELAQVVGAFLAIVCEPDKDDEIDSGKLKRFSGLDDFFARNCHENGGSVAMLAKILYVCNDPPTISNADGAVVNRLIIIPFLAQWIKNCNLSLEEQYLSNTFKADGTFEETIPRYLSAFAWILIQYYNIYKVRGCSTPPASVTEYTQNYWKNNDPYLKFIDEFMERDENSNVNTIDLYTHFYPWFRTTQAKQSNTLMSEDKFKNEMLESRRLGPQKNNRWLGWKVVSKRR